MNRRSVALLATLAVVAGAGVAVSGGAANAYPPGTALTVAAVPQPVKPSSPLTVTASNVKPGCYVTFILDGRYKTVRATGPTVSAVITSPKKSGTKTLRAKTGGCSAKETAYTQVVIKGDTSNHNKAKVKAEADGKKVEVWVSGFAPKTAVVVKLSRNGVTYSATGTTSSKGNAEFDFKVKDKGCYLVTASSGGKVLMTYVTVR